MSMGLDVDNDVDLEGWVGDVENDVENDIKQFARLFFVFQSDETVGSVPVDTGRFRNSWNSAVNEKDTSHPEVSDDGPFGKPDFDVSGFELGDTINITNAIPYAVKLNGVEGQEGSVRQVGDHFFERNFQSAWLRIKTAD